MLSKIKKMLGLEGSRSTVIVIIPKGDKDAEMKVNSWISTKMLKPREVYEVESAEEAKEILEGVKTGGRIVIITVSTIADGLKGLAYSEGVVVIDVESRKSQPQLGC